MKKVTVLGAGNGGHALAFQLSKLGYSVLVYEHPDFSGNIEGIKRNGGIEAMERIERNGKEIVARLSGFAEIDALTTDMQEALDYSNTLLMIVPSYAQETFFKLAIPHLKDSQTLVILPGNFGSLVIKRMMDEAGVKIKALFAETNSLPYACRMISPGRVFILAVKEALYCASFPGAEIKRFVTVLTEILPLKLLTLNNVLGTGLSNANMIVHPATAVLNMGVAESRKGGFYFYKEGMSESVSKVQQRIDDERLSVAKALDLNLESFTEHQKTFYNIDSKSIYDFAQTTPIHSSFGYDAPKSPRDRYVSEDCPYLLVPVFEFGRILGIETPATESIIRIASIYNDVDYFKEGRTLDKLGLSGITREQILECVQ